MVWKKPKINKGYLVFRDYHRLSDLAGSLQMRPSCWNYKKHALHRLTSSWGILTTWMYTGKSNMVDNKISQQFLECVEDNFLTQVLDKLSIEEAFLDLILISAEELIKENKLGDSLGSSDHTLVEFVMLRRMGLFKSKIRTLKFTI